MVKLNSEYRSLPHNKKAPQQFQLKLSYSLNTKHNMFKLNANIQLLDDSRIDTSIDSSCCWTKGYDEFVTIVRRILNDNVFRTVQIILHKSDRLNVHNIIILSIILI